MRRDRPRFALPPGINLSDFEFDEPLPPKPKKPTHRGTRGRNNRPSRLRRGLHRKAQYRLKVLQIKQQEFEAQWLRMRAAEIARDVAADKLWLKQYAEREAAHQRAEAEMARVRQWYATQIAKESAVAKPGTPHQQV
jgi:hypothetical protein